LVNGETYAIVVTDIVAANAFVKTYPADISPIYPPEFPDFIFNQLQDNTLYIGGSVEGQTEAISLILDKYNSGITLMRQDSNGEFYPIIIREETQINGNKNYINIPCNN
jgi:hypothetical protein